MQAPSNARVAQSLKLRMAAGTRDSLVPPTTTHNQWRREVGFNGNIYIHADIVCRCRTNFCGSVTFPIAKARYRSTAAA